MLESVDNSDLKSDGPQARGGSSPPCATMDNSDKIFKCECGREFKSFNSLKSHYRFCKVHKPKSKVSKYKISDTLYRCECGKEFDNFQSLNSHFSHCDFHHTCLGTIRKGHTSELTKSMCWDNKTPDEIRSFHVKSGKTLARLMQEGLVNFPYNGKPNYSIKACRYIDSINKKYGWNLQHAENGGEIRVVRYFPDGYDAKLNIVFEYDEPHHYLNVQENILCERDIERQQYIIEKLNCRFFRYNEKLDLFYEVNTIT